VERRVLRLWLVVSLSAVIAAGCLETSSDPAGESHPQDIKTFDAVAGPVETIDGKPVIRLFATTWCPHSTFVKGPYEKVCREYVAAGKIVAHLWELDLGDDVLTPAPEGTVPAAEEAVFERFNPAYSVPTLVFGGKYYRIGSGYEGQANGQALEEAEFRAVIEEVIRLADAQ
jgi:hypothetical protein